MADLHCHEIYVDIYMDTVCVHTFMEILGQKVYFLGAK